MYYTLVYVAGAPEMRAFIVFGLRAVSQVLKPSLPLSSKSGLERDLLEYNLKAAALFTRVPYIAIIVASGSLKWLSRTLSIIYSG